MATYKISLDNAAERHFEAGEHLYANTHRKDVAGYLYGIAAECAVKELMRRGGMQPAEPKMRREDPFFAHFPELKTLLRNRLQGRNSKILQSLIGASFMQGWDVAMRYTSSSEIAHNKVGSWRDQAKQAVSAMRGN